MYFFLEKLKEEQTLSRIPTAVIPTPADVHDVFEHLMGMTSADDDGGGGGSDSQDAHDSGGSEKSLNGSFGRESEIGVLTVLIVPRSSPWRGAARRRRYPVTEHSPML